MNTPKKGLKEKTVEYLLNKHLTEKGWIIKKDSEKKAGEHGCDIIARNPVWNKYYYIECKGDGKAKVQQIHNAFYTLFGQILSRMDVAGNIPNSSRYYAWAIPASWEKTFKNKIKKMAYGWKLLKLKIFLVDENGIQERSYTHFLKK